MAEPTRTRRTFGPVVALGLAAAGLASVAGTKPWVSGSSGTISTDQASGQNASGAGMSSLGTLDGVRDSPLAGALALTVLACWGVLLVTRGKVRRAVSILSLVGSLALAVVVVEAFGSLQTKLTDALLAASGTDTASVSVSAWYLAAALGAVLCLATTAAAVAYVGSWPEMGSKYDAPREPRSDGAGEDVATMPEENIELWKALDEGRDPTA